MGKKSKVVTKIAGQKIKQAHMGAAPPPDGRHDGTSEFPIVALGASAGGLDALGKFLDALPPRSGMAFILVQHLDPAHKSMIADLLSARTSMIVREATAGTVLEPDHAYVIPPGTYLSVGNGSLCLSKPSTLHGARMPFDFLLQSLAREYGDRTFCVVLSGTGTDGSMGVKAVKENGGFAIVQQPEEASFDGMPRSAILTGAVDLVLPVAGIPEALTNYARLMASARARHDPEQQKEEPAWLGKIIELLHLNSGRNFNYYKRGTLQRRIERRMAIAGFSVADAERYCELLRTDAAERQVLINDLFIGVTSFFRDPTVFEFIKTTIVPDLLRHHPPNRPLRIWVPGCCTGEEAYSLAMLFLERIEATKSDTKLQIFATDIDADAIAFARQSVYSEAIVLDVPKTLLERYFFKERDEYRPLPVLRETVLFAVHDLLVDAPFLNIDMISCRNLFIYLTPEAQKRAASLFNFSLINNGILLLGSAEMISGIDTLFAVISKAGRVYRHIRGHERRENGQLISTPHAAGGRQVPTSLPQPINETALVDFCERLLLKSFAPPSVLIDRENQCLYFIGRINNYLKVPEGKAGHNLFAMASEGIANKLRFAIQRAYKENSVVIAHDCHALRGGVERAFSIVVQPAPHGGRELMLISFIEKTSRERKRELSRNPPHSPEFAEAKLGGGAAAGELESIIEGLEVSNKVQMSANTDLQSVNEELQSANEELLTSKEELQSLNEELISLNGQLQETLGVAQKASDDLQNLLSNVGVAIFFLGSDLNILFFTPAAKSIVHVIRSDIGRPITDLNALDGCLHDIEAQTLKVLNTEIAVDQEIGVGESRSFVRRIAPYRDRSGKNSGVVVTFIETTEEKRAAAVIDAAKKQAQLADLAKSRFLAVASHDLRQPLQSLALLNAMLAESAKDEKSQQLLARADQTLRGMSGILNALLDINQIEAGTIATEVAAFPVGDLLARLQQEFDYIAQARDISLRVVNCSVLVNSDPRLLEQIMRNLLANALKYTNRGKVLLGCRRRKRTLSIEVWDTGVGIPAEERDAIFSAYHQLNKSDIAENHGFGLGLSIVKSLASMLDHKVSVQSRPGRGSMFAVEVGLAMGVEQVASEHREDHTGEDRRIERSGRLSVILIVEDETDVRELLKQHLEDKGYRVAAAADGFEALDLVAREAIRPDLILADLNLPNGMDGLQVVAKLREHFQRQIPVIVLSGNISADAIRRVSLQNCMQFSKPVNVRELTQTIQRILPIAKSVAEPTERRATTAAGDGPPTVFVIDDDRQVLEAMRSILQKAGFTVETYANCELFLKSYRAGGNTCLILDAYLPGMSGLDLLRRLRNGGDHMPVAIITGRGDVALAVEAMKTGACDFIEKPTGAGELIASVRRALEPSSDFDEQASRLKAAGIIEALTPREHEILDMILAGRLNKNIAADLGISQRTVESHRAAIMKKTGSNSLPALARLALTAKLGSVSKVAR